MQDVVICFRILAFITNFNEIGREQIRTIGNDLLRMSWQYFPFTCRKEDEVTVCELFDQYERKGKAEGEARRRNPYPHKHIPPFCVRWRLLGIA